MPDYKKEWFQKARVDYFSPFVNLWLACNSWYNFHYADLTTDRAHVDKLKTDFGRQNALYKKFECWYVDIASSKEQKRLFTNLEMLHFSLERANITVEKLKKPLKFSSLCIDYNQKDNETGYENLLIINAKKANGKLKTIYSTARDLGEIVMIDDIEKVFAGLIELIYQVRCSLVHGSLPPTEENHEVVKYCYLILHDLMEDFCS